MSLAAKPLPRAFLTLSGTYSVSKRTVHISGQSFWLEMFCLYLDYLKESSGKREWLLKQSEYIPKYKIHSEYNQTAKPKAPASRHNPSRTLKHAEHTLHVPRHS
ncbi:MAG: hypothetical protein LBQ48_05380 [Oscillospiraceae bacterium]|jgi:hypothetical protein|nr:hypothetical protein [Oscillospiraceae bacterium]